MWFFNKKKNDPELPGIHPKSKEPKKDPNKTGEQTAPAANKAKKTSPNKSVAEENLNKRKAEFAKAGINYWLIEEIEKKYHLTIDPNLFFDTKNRTNNTLMDMGFKFSVTSEELLQAQVIEMDYNKMRIDTQTQTGKILPAHDIISILVIREAEKQIRLQNDLTENPQNEQAAKQFQKQSQVLCEKMWIDPRIHQLRSKATRQIIFDKKLKNNDVIPKLELEKMMDLIATKEIREQALRQVEQDQRKSKIPISVAEVAEKELRIKAAMDKFFLELYGIKRV